MRCSLLTLSSYIDSELTPARTGELEAHLVGCTRCATALEYLREESARVGGLARVEVPDHAARALFQELALLSPDDELPGEVRRPWVRDAEAPAEPPPWLGETPGKALPWAPQRPERVSDQEQRTRDPRASTAVAVHPDQMAMSMEQETAPMEVRGLSISDVTVAPPEHQVPVAPPSPPVPAVPAAPAIPPAIPAVTGPPRRVAAGPLKRLRDAIALRMTLIRGGAIGAEDSFDIVTGPVRGTVADMPVETPVETPVQAPPITPAPTKAPLSPMPTVESEPMPVVHETVPSPVRPARETPMGRHARSLNGKAHVRTSWTPLRSQPAGRGDRRLWVFGGVVLALMLVGFLLGKSATPLQSTSRASQHPGASTTPHAAIAAPVPSLVTTPAPTAPPAASASQLTGGRTLGQASSGYSVGDLRYGNHPGDCDIFHKSSDRSDAGRKRGPEPTARGPSAGSPRKSAPAISASVAASGSRTRGF